MVRMTLLSRGHNISRRDTTRILPTFLVCAALLFTLTSSQSYAQLSGSYTIGTGQTYTTLVAFANALNSQGVSGPVTATVLPGTYTGSVVFNSITGASSTNTITITGANVNTAKIEAATNSSNSYVIRLNGTDYLSLNDLSITATGATYGYGVWFQNTANYNEIVDCKITVPSSTSSYAIGILASGSSYSSYGNTANYNTIEGNEITGGYYGVRFNGNGSSTNCFQNEFYENVVTDFYYYGMYMYYQKQLVLERNTIIDRGAYYNAYGVYLYYCRTGPKVNGNTIVAGTYGLYSYRANQDNSVYGEICSNMITTRGTSTNYGLRIYYYNYKMNVDNNSINMLTNSTAYGLYYYYGSNGRFRNNIVQYMGTGTHYFVYVYSSYSVVPIMDYNVFWSPNSTRDTWRYNGYDYSLSQFKAAISSQNNNSWMYDPEFNDNYDLHTYSQNLNGSGTPLSHVTEDADGDSRHATTPDIGADEYTLHPLDAGAVSLIAPTEKCGLGATENITIGIRNYGTSTIDASVTPITVTVTVLGGMNQNFTATMTSGTIAPGATSSFSVTNALDLSVAGPYTFDATITMPGDGNVANNAMKTASLYVDGTIASYPHFEDFEAGDGNFRSVSLGGINDWNYGTPNNNGITSANSGTKVWMTGITANYSNNAHAALMAPCLDFTNLTAPVLQFYSNFSTESPYDGWAVEASGNGGATWTRLTPYYPPYNYTYSYGPQGAPQYAHRTSFKNWQKYVFLLGSYAFNPNVKVRWRFGSDGSVNNYPGVAIDDVAFGDFYQKDMVVTDVVYDNATNYWARRVGANHVIHARIVNFGYEKNPATVPLTYKENGIPSFQGDGVGESFSPSWSGAEAWVTFATPHMPMNSGPMTMYVRSFYPGDLDGSNDMAKTTPVIQPPTVYGYEDFNSLTPPNWEKLWTVSDVNGGETWVTEAGIGTGGTVAATYPGDVTTADDWLFTPGAWLEAGSSYSLDFMYRSRNGDAQILEVAFGPSPDPSSMTVFASYANFTNTSFTAGLGQYGVAPFFATPNVAQLYYIGFHVKSAGGMGPLDLDDIRLKNNPFPPPKIAYGINPVYSSDPLIPIKFSGVYKKTGLLTRTYEVINSTGWYGNPEGDMLWDVNCTASWVDLFKSTPDPLTFLTTNPFSPPWARQRQTFTMEINASILPPGTHTTSLDFDAYLYNTVYTRGIRASNAIFSVPVELTLSAAGGAGSGANNGAMTYASMDASGNPWVFQDLQGNVFAVVNVTGGFIPSMTITSYPGQLPKHISRYRYVDHYWTIDATGANWSTDIEFHYFDSEVLSGGVIDEWWLRGIRIPKGMGYWEDPIMNTMSMPNAFDHNVMVVNINDKNYDGEIALAHDWNLVPGKQSDGNIPTTYTLDQNYPNPFNPSTEIRFGIPSEEHVTLTVINSLGEEVARIVNQVLPAGFHAYNFDAKGMPSGMYLYTISAGDFVQTRTMILSK